MELLKDRVNKVSIESEGITGTPTISSWKLNGVIMQGAINVSRQDPYFVATLPYLPAEGEIELTWEITVPNVGPGNFQRKTYHTVVTPYLSRSEVSAALSDDNADLDPDEVEAAVRHLINAHTGQTFGMHTGVKEVVGKGFKYLQLPERLISYDSVVGYPNFYHLNVEGNGWYLSPSGYTTFIPPVRADYDGVNTQTTSGVPITVPGWMRSGGGFAKGERFKVSGTWGWRSVPEPVRQAAKLLVNDLSSDEAVYRDKNIKSISAADWRLEFTSGAYGNLGNVRANQLLSDYVLPRGWMVL